jgi:hypothetical protein
MGVKLGLSLEGKNRLMMFDCLRLFGPNKKEVTGGWRNYKMGSFKTCTFIR